VPSNNDAIILFFILISLFDFLIVVQTPR